MSSDLPIAVIGAGPKGLALAAKAATLRELGYKLPKIILFERHQAGAAWTGEIGYTDGIQPLGTPPEKDIGFPYHSKFQRKELNANGAQIDSLMLRYSWQAYQVAEGKFQIWIDRGRSAPLHHEWASYLQWVEKSIGESPHFSVIKAKVSELVAEKNSWRVRFGDESEEILAQCLVITGPGKAKENIAVDNAVRDRVLDGQDFWLKLEELRNDPAKPEITVIGSGETAGSVAAALTKGNNRITIICKEPVVFSRGETFQENAMYSNPDDWQGYPIDFRKEFISRTDRGVFSQKVKADLDNCDRIGYVPGTVRVLDKDERGRRQVVYEVGSTVKKKPFDWVVIATGFDPLWFGKILNETARKRLINSVGELTTDKISRKINWNLAVEGCKPRLHLPMLAGLMQGPGFPNLSCLGTLSDRILEAYISGLT